MAMRMEHANLDALVDGGRPANADDLTLRRLKKRRLALRDAISRLELELLPAEPA